jgi:hypothetical protein
VRKRIGFVLMLSVFTVFLAFGQGDKPTKKPATKQQATATTSKASRHAKSAKAKGSGGGCCDDEAACAGMKSKKSPSEQKTESQDTKDTK